MAVTSQLPPNGGRFYDEPAVLASYLEHRHSPATSPNIVMEEPAFMSAMGDIDNQRVLDLGCGDAAFGGIAIAHGALTYVGVDGSAAMVRQAQGHATDPRISIVHDRIEDHRPEPSSYDLVTSRMALHYIADLHAVFLNVRTALRPGGRLIFSVVHPVITSTTKPVPGPRTDTTVDRYFERGPRQREWFGSTVTWHHRTVEDYLTSLQRSGFDFVSLGECEPDSALLADQPDELDRRRRVPVMLLVQARRAHD